MPGSTQRWADPTSRVLVVSGTRIRPVDGRVEWVPTAEAPDGMRVLLGEQDDVTWFAVIVDPALASEEKSEWFGPARGLLAPPGGRRLRGAAAVPRGRAGGVALRDPVLPALRR